MDYSPIQKIALTAKNYALWWGPVLALIVYFSMEANGWSHVASIAGAISALCAVWWIFEPIPIPATSLIPLGFFPLFDVLTGKQVAQAYGDPLILLLIGGAMLSKAMEKCGVHRRLALGMVQIIGGKSSSRVVFGFMIASALLSMWISNTATTFMLLPVMLAVIEKAEDPKLAMPLLLGVAYAASIGGMGTPVGTTPNVLFMRIYEQTTGIPVTFSEWMLYGLPVVIVFVPLAALWLTRNLNTGGKIDIPRLGKWTQPEIRVLIVFALTAVAWITMKEPNGGWMGYLGLKNASLGTVALVAVVVLFLCPDGTKKDGIRGRLLDWESAVSIHWGVFILFAGGITIATAFQETGISEAMGNALAGLSSLNTFFIIVIVCLTVTFLTEVTSNTATSTLLMPILAAAAVGAGIDPKLLMIPAALSASCAFMLPVATAPNAIVFSADRMKVQDMAREGFVLNFIGVVVISVLIYLIVQFI